MAVNTVKDKELKFEFTPTFLKSIDLLLTSYQTGIDTLIGVCNHPNIDEEYGVCDTSYKMRYITPNDITTFVSYVGRLLTDSVFDGRFSIENVGDSEKMAVAMMQRSVIDNGCVPFENTNAYGDGTYIDERSITLGKLIIMANNEFYDKRVYSKYEMIERAKAMKSDLDKMEKMNLARNVRKLINNIPNVMMSSCEILKYNRNKLKSTIDIIERFLLTACTINMTTIDQMAWYVLPGNTFKVKDLKDDREKRLDYDYYGETTISDGVVVESVNLEENRPVFINLSTGGDNFVSNTIKRVSGEDYSHSSIAFDPSLDVMYTFNGGIGLDDKYGIQKPGFQREALRSSKFKKVRVTTYCTFVPNEIWKKMKKAVEDMEASNPKYDYKAIADRWYAIDKYGKDANPRRGDTTRRQVCSTFVNSIMSIAGEVLGEKEIVSPGEMNATAMSKPNKMLKIYDGLGGDYDPNDAMDKILNFAKSPSSKIYYESFVTECCLLKTNNMRVSSRIPFNCNMRDVVLQDMHPKFKDTKSAIMFMVTDERSPITELLRKYRTVREMDNNVRVLNMFMRLKECHCNCDPETKDPRNHFFSMHTDVNWLDKIAYGNQFLDGNYRQDAMGNNKFTPVEQALSHLYSMYSPDGEKTNEDLANNIVIVANAMISVIDQYNNKHDGGVVYNWELFRDILATFGEIMTRSMLRLYNNNAIVINASDDMPDTMAAGYMYTESFEMFLEAAEPSIKVTKTKEGASRVMGNIKQVFQMFIQWCSRVFQQIVTAFKKNHDMQIKWVKDHEADNQGVKNALSKGFEINMANFHPFKIQSEIPGSLKIKDTLVNVIKDTSAETPTPVKLFGMILQTSGNEEVKGIGKDAMTLTDMKEPVARLKNYYLYGQNETEMPNQPTKLTPEIWDEIVSDLKNSEKLVVKVSDDLMKQIKPTNDELKNLLNAADNKVGGESFDIDIDNSSMFMEQDPPASDGTNGGAPSGADQSAGGAGNKEDNSKLNAVATMYYKNIVPVLTDIFSNETNKTFYAYTYKIYRNVIAAYRSQYQEPTQSQPQKTSDNPDASANPAGANAGTTGTGGDGAGGQ